MGNGCIRRLSWVTPSGKIRWARVKSCCELGNDLAYASSSSTADSGCIRDCIVGSPCKRGITCRTVSFVSPSLGERHGEGGGVSNDVSLTSVLPRQEGGLVETLRLLPLVLYDAAHPSPLTRLHDIEIALRIHPDTMAGTVDRTAPAG